MKQKRILAIVLLFFIACANVCAISNEDKEMLKQHARAKVRILNDYISYVADPMKRRDTRNMYRERAYKLFINDCNAYKEILECKDLATDVLYVDTISNPGVTMGVTSLRNTTPRQKPMKQYFRGLMNLGYKTVKIETTDIADMRVSELQPYGKDENGRMMYVCSVYFDQLFNARRADGRSYVELTRKWVVCYVQVDNVLDEKTGETKEEYRIRLGDVYAVSTEKVF